MASSTALRELQQELETKANDLNKLQKDIGKNHEIRKKYTIQLGENELVLKELDLLNEDANVYKQIGPVLVKQDLAEANANVRKRIEYISAELKRLEGTLQDMEGKQNSKKEALMGLGAGSICMMKVSSFIYTFRNTYFVESISIEWSILLIFRKKPDVRRLSTSDVTF
ncbi:Prefoldin subunit 6 [Ranunculus cassubicifolius]